MLNPDPAANKEEQDIAAMRRSLQCMDVKSCTSFGQLDVRMTLVCEELGQLDVRMTGVCDELACVRADVRDIRDSVRELEKKLDTILRNESNRSIFWD